MVYPHPEGVTRVPYKPQARTIYVRKGDYDLWSRADRLSEDRGGLSATVAEALRSFLHTEDLKMHGFAEVSLRVEWRHPGSHEREVEKTVRFLGKLLLEGDQAYIAGADAVFVTPQGKLVFFVRTGESRDYPGVSVGSYGVYKSVEEAWEALKSAPEELGKRDAVQYAHDVDSFIKRLMHALAAANLPDRID